MTHEQDVFLSNRIVRSRKPEADQSARLRLAVNVTHVLYDDLQPGTRLEFLGDESREADMAEPETVFLHFDDSRVVYPYSPEESVYLTVPKKALDWYQSLTADQTRDLETKSLSRRRT